MFIAGAGCWLHAVFGGVGALHHALRQTRIAFGIRFMEFVSRGFKRGRRLS